MDPRFLPLGQEDSLRIFSSLPSEYHLEVDIGCNNGQLLVRLARSNPQKFFIGVELSFELAREAVERLKHYGVKNAIVIGGDGRHVMAGGPGRNSLNAVHIYFPTPPPATENGGILLNRAFVEDTYRALKTLGTMRIATDDREYFHSACALLDPRRWWEVPWSPPLDGLGQDSLVGSPWENRHRREGRAIYSTQVLSLPDLGQRTEASDLPE